MGEVHLRSFSLVLNSLRLVQGDSHWLCAECLGDVMACGCRYTGRIHVLGMGYYLSEWTVQVLMLAPSLMILGRCRQTDRPGA